MRDVLAPLLVRWGAGETVGLGTVVGTWRSAPRQPGAAMLVGADGEAVGSVSGGCVESDVYALAEQVIADGTPVLTRYGISDRDAFAAGLTCGGILDVFVQPVSAQTFPELGEVATMIESGVPVAVATVVEHPEPDLLGRRLVITDDAVIGTLDSDRRDAAITDDTRGLLKNGITELITYGPDGQRRGEGMRVFVSSYAPKPRMIVCGAIDFAAAIARLGTFLGYRVTVCDARPVFATRTRFPDVDEVVVDWPHRYLAGEVDAGRIDPRTVICVITHDPKFDVPLLEVALRLDVSYVGAMGSRRTHDDRRARLRETGLTDAELARLSSPIGLDLGARTPEETAVSIAAEIIAQAWGGTGRQLSGLDGTIHHSQRSPEARSPSSF